MSRSIKRLFPETLVVVGGVHFMYCARETLENVPEIDIVVRGEGEVTIVELTNAIDRGLGLETIRGITYRRDGHVVENPPQEVFEELDSIPVYTRFTWEEYPEYLFGYPEQIRALSVMSSRGCPYKCVFCSKAGMKYRLRQPHNVVDEIEQLRDRFGIEGVNFLDLTFTANPGHARAMSEELIRRKLDLSWWCESRANIPPRLSWVA